MKAQTPTTEFSLWRSEHLYNIDFAGYTLSHHSFPRHFHDHYVIELVVKGADSFYCDGKSYTAYNNQLVLINPGEVHTGSTIADTSLRYFSLYPDKKALQQVAGALDITVSPDLNFHQCLHEPSSLTHKLTALFHSLHTNDDTLQQQEIFFDCMQALLQQAGKTTTEPDRTDTRIKLLTDFIHSHFKEEISLQQMAGLVNLNPFHLVRLFKKTIGVSPYDYLLILRTEYAKQLLRKDYKVQDAAQQAGFYDTSHFNRSLRKIAGTSPRSFLLSKGQYRTTFGR
ncbi:MAG: AraC family transcriptional regulator [Bacteroidota bacterium]